MYMLANMMQRWEVVAKSQLKKVTKVFYQQQRKAELPSTQEVGLSESLSLTCLVSTVC